MNDDWFSDPRTQVELYSSDSPGVGIYFVISTKAGIAGSMDGNLGRVPSVVFQVVKNDKAVKGAQITAADLEELAMIFFDPPDVHKLVLSLLELTLCDHAAGAMVEAMSKLVDEGHTCSAFPEGLTKPKEWEDG